MSQNKLTSIETILAKDIEPLDGSSSHILPIHATSAFSYNDIESSIRVFEGEEEGFVYSRYGNPTIQFVEQKLASLESHGIDLEAAALLTGSGLSAISTFLMSHTKAGDAILTQDDLYGGTTELIKKVLAKAGVEVFTTDLSNHELVDEKLKSNSNIKVVYFETPANPTLKCVDIEVLASLAKSYDCISAIDNTFSTFYLQKPFKLGVDYVLYSTTKFLNGHGNSIAGAIICRSTKERMIVWDTMKLLGTNCNAWDAWLLNNGLKTLALRLERHSDNALKIAEFLNGHNKVLRVNYPGLETHPSFDIAQKQMTKYGGMLSFEINGSYDQSLQFMNNTELCSITATLGNVDTLLLHPASSSHLKVDKEVRMAAGISDGLVRMSVGIENVDDLIADIDRALRHV